MGVNEYVTPACAVVLGVPLMVGGRLGAIVTWRVNAGNDAARTPSVTVIKMPACVAATGGVPKIRPVVESICSHVGALPNIKVSRLLSASLAVGVHE